ncbi:unnamed protein product [Callosobruchus maculatus]|uniref:Uncharacterized protein n=1 Tax=Callosobruchus maculatus TaxID=64391 RepID=A0A653DIH5_CALMS|nr:unnamed protein product [Callosobruchus maculatus]
MPKRRGSPLINVQKRQRIDTLLQELEHFKARFVNLGESSSSEDEDQPATSPVHSGLEDLEVTLDNHQAEPSSRPSSSQPVDNPPSLATPVVNTDLSAALGAKPTDSRIQGEALHDEIASRWEYYLQKGVKKEERQKIIEKYPIPKNTPVLAPPKINDEVLDCLNDSANKKDYFLRSLQYQMAHGLTAIPYRTSCQANW